MRVLCINADFSNQTHRPAFKYLQEIPVELKEYTIRDVQEISGQIGYMLEEIFAGIGPSGKEISFDSSRFVPLMDSMLEEELMETKLELQFIE